MNKKYIGIGIFIIIALVIVCGLLSMDNSKYNKVEMSDYSVMDTAQLDKVLESWVKSNSKKEGLHYKVMEGNTYALINAGKLGSGSGIIIEEVTKNKTHYKVKYSVNEVKNDEYKENVSVLIKFNSDLKVTK